MIRHRFGRPVHRLAFSPAGDLLAVAGDRLAAVWAPAGGPPVVLADALPASPSRIGFSPDGRRVLTASGIGDTMTAWPAAGGPWEFAVGTADGTDFGFGPDGRALFVLATRLTCWDWAARAPMWHTAAVHSGNMSSAGSLAVGPAGRAAVGLHGRGSQAVRFYDLATGKPAGRVTRKGGRPDRLTYSPDGRRLAVVAGDGELAILDLDHPDADAVAPAGPDAVTAAAFRPDGRALAAACGDGTGRMYDTASWRETARLDWAAGRVRDVAFAPDGLRAGCCTDDGTVVVWDVDA